MEIVTGRCPGMDPANWKFDDIFEAPCAGCGAPIEFWKDDVKRTCPACKGTAFNPRLGNLCLAWCAQAEECLGNRDIREWKKGAAGRACPDRPEKPQNS